MPYHFEFEAEHRILLAVLEGDVQNEELLRVNREIRGLIKKLKPAAGITDASPVETFNVSPQTIRTLSSESSPYPDPIPRFLVAPTDFLFGMARMYTIGGDREEVQVVRSRAEALAAIGAENAKFEKLEN